jgi:hypothetical protein
MNSNHTKQSVAVKQQLQVPFEEGLFYSASMDAIAAVLDKARRTSIAHAPWPMFPYQPDVQISLLHSGDCLFLKFYVEEATVAAANGETHTAVYKDSCVEFFVSFDDKGYYNLEFNCTGTCLAAFGKNREERVFFPVEAVNGIRRRAVIDRSPERTGIQWSLIVAIPLNTFVFHELHTLRGVACRANFFKCGDDLPQPHFLTWSLVETPEPDFHQPGYFGTLVFE